eukprot:scaffold53284_cov33-Tisochrysis_lutea.AAC.2
MMTPCCRWDPIAYALGFLDCDHISARCMLTIFMLFAIRSEASVLRMLEGSPQTYLHDPIIKYLEDRGVKINLRTPIRDLPHEVQYQYHGRMRLVFKEYEAQGLGGSKSTVCMC